LIPKRKANEKPHKRRLNSNQIETEPGKKSKVWSLHANSSKGKWLILTLRRLGLVFHFFFFSFLSHISHRIVLPNGLNNTIKTRLQFWLWVFITIFPRNQLNWPNECNEFDSMDIYGYMLIYSGPFGFVDAANPRPLIVQSEIKKNMWKGRRRVVNAIRIHKYSHADMRYADRRLYSRGLQIIESRLWNLHKYEHWK